MLTISNLSKAYVPGRPVLASVTLSIPQGLFGLLGPNGAGKSTLMRTIATLQEPDTGTIALDGVNVFADVRRHRARLGYLPQDFGVYPGESCERLLHHVAILKGLTDRRARAAQVDELLEQTNLAPHRRDAVSDFSGGMRQRFGVAQALLGAPRLVVVDEPTAGLDPEERNRFLNLLSAIGERVVVVLSTHIVEDVRQLCSEMAILARGTIVASGPPEQLCATLRGRLWQRTVTRDEVDAARRNHAILSEQLVAGRTRVRVVSDRDPGDGFIGVEPELDDAYFASLGRHDARSVGPVE